MVQVHLGPPRSQPYEEAGELIDGTILVVGSKMSVLSVTRALLLCGLVLLRPAGPGCMVRPQTARADGYERLVLPAVVPCVCQARLGSPQ